MLLCIYFIYQYNTPPRIKHTDVERIKNLIRGVAPEKVDSLEFYVDNESYTLNKKEVHLCIYNPEGELYPDNMLVYVALHELAHALYQGDSSHHPDDYYQLFNSLLDRGEQLGIYTRKIPVDRSYCMQAN